MSQTEPHVRATEIFPELSDEMDRRIAHGETRIKFWIMTGILVNLLMAVAAAIPIVLIGGRMIERTEAAISTSAANQALLTQRSAWMQDRVMWESSIEPYLETLGWERPRYMSSESLRPASPELLPERR